MGSMNKLADLKALASSAVAEESSKAASLLKQVPEADRENTQPKRASPATRGQPKTKPRRAGAGAVTRVPSVLRATDMKAINAAKIYLMQGGGAGVSTNNVIQMALRSMKIGPELVKLAEEILGEDGRRKQ